MVVVFRLRYRVTCVRGYLAFMEKYGDPNWDRPKGFFPRLDQVTVYAITVERMIDREAPFPGAQKRWPATDHSASPDAVAP